MFELFIDDIKFGEQEDLGLAMNLKTVLEELMVDNEITVREVDNA